MTDPDYKAIRQKLIEDNKLSLEAVFVPLSQSRNKDKKNKSLNWKVTLLKGTYKILTTDYSKGIGHVPKYIQGGFKLAYDQKQYEQYLSKVTETGKAAGTMKRDLQDYSKIVKKEFYKWKPNSYAYEPIVPIDPPSVEEVLYNLVMDASVLESGGFEGWCFELGFNPDSISHHKIYQECVEIAIKLQGSLGAKLLSDLREAYNDY